MKVEVLYLAGCPHRALAVGRVLEALKHEGVSAEMVEIEVQGAATARQLRFLGSPTVRINGQDVELPARRAQAFGLACRTYADQGRRVDAPPLEWICAAMREARQR